MKRFITFLYILFVPLLLLVNIQPAFALNPKQRLEIEQRPWLDLTDCYSSGGGNSTPAPTGGVTAGKVYLLGDSIAAGSLNELKAAFQTKGLTPQEIDALGGRNIQGTNPSPDGLTALTADESKWADAKAVVFELGTNTGGFSAENVKAMTKTVRDKNPGAKIFWVTSFRTDTPDKGAGQNKVLTDNASSSGYTVIDWFNVVKDHATGPGAYLGDNAHPNAAGLPVFVKTVVDGVTGGGYPATPSPSPSPTPTPTTPASPTQITVPEPYKTLFPQAAKKYNTDPGLLGTVFYIEHGKSFPEPPPPYGNGRAWASSPAGASGPFQFIPSTWNAYAEDANNDGKKDVQDLTDAAYGAAHLLASMGGTAGKSIGDVNDPYKTDTYLPVMIGYNWGPGHVQNKDLPLPGETANYIKIGAEAYASISSQLGGGGGGQITTNSCSGLGNNVSPGGGNLTKAVEIANQELVAFQAGSYDIGKFNGHPGAWCADFLSYVLKQAGVPFTGGGDGGWHIPTVEGVQAYFESIGAWHPKGQGYVPKPGDVVVYNQGVSPYPQHVNIIVEVSGNGFTTIGGNEGNKVSKNSHASFDAPYITGYGTPKAP